MDVHVRLAGRIVRPVWMLVVLVMDVGVLVGERIVTMLVHVALGDVQVDSKAHQKARHRHLDGYGIPEQSDGERGTDKRRRGKVGAGAGGA